METYTRHEGGIAYRHTALGTRVWRKLAMSDPIEGQAMLDALLADPVAPARQSTRWQPQRHRGLAPPRATMLQAGRGVAGWTADIKSRAGR